MTEGEFAARPGVRDTLFERIGYSGARSSAVLPNFRNPAVLLRALVLAEACNLIAFALAAPTLSAAIERLADWNPLFEFTMLWAALLLFLCAPWLRKLPYALGAAATVLVAALAAAGAALAGPLWLGEALGPGMARSALIAGGVAALLLAYFDWRQRALSPALAQARLIALQARIRPHFLFNSINTALSLLRQNPAQAEAVLLDLSDLFRVVLAERRSLVPLADEIRLARSYLDIEQLRLGERLRVNWDCEAAPMDAQVPILLLQPLVENAVHHGIEPSPGGGDVVVRIGAGDETLYIEVANSIHDSAREISPGNRIALANIGERLDLHFDSEAQLRTFRNGARFVVQVRVPLVKGRSAVFRRGV